MTNPPPPACQIVFFTCDLMFSSRLTGAAQASGAKLIVTSSPETAQASCAEDATRLVILDLSMPGVDPATLVPQLRAASASAAIVAYGPHVHKARLEAATDAGCDQVMSRGQFDAEVGALVAKYCGS